MRQDTVEESLETRRRRREVWVYTGTRGTPKGGDWSGPGVRDRVGSGSWTGLPVVDHGRGITTRTAPT